MEAADIAWAVGLFEGEGCIMFFKQKHHVLTHVRLALAMTDKDVVDRFCRIVECGKVSPEQRRPKPNHKSVYVWQISNRHDVERILLAFRPWFGERRTAKADALLAEIATLNRECRHCAAPFRARRLDMWFCGTRCRNQWNYLNRRPAERPSNVGRPRVLEVSDAG